MGPIGQRVFYTFQDRKTALYWAVEKGHDDIVQLLIDNDADLEISTKVGNLLML